MVPSLPATPLLTIKTRWSAQETSRAIEQLQSLSPGLIVAPLKDTQYGVLTDASVRRFLEYWKPLADEMRRDLPTSSASNCNNFSLALRLMANLAGMRSNIAEPIVASAIVYHVQPFGGLPPTHENHDVILFYTETGWWVSEAQTGFIAPIGDYPNRHRLIFISLH